MSRIDDLIAELCPDGVEFKTLGSLGKWYGGGTPSKTRGDYWNGGTIPWVSPKDMGKRVVTETKDQITEAAVLGSSAKKVPPVSVLMVVRSSILDHTFPVALAPIEVTLNQDMKGVVPNEHVSAAYLGHLLASKDGLILQTCRKSGGSVSSLDSSKLMNFRLPVPPLEVQQEIVKVLDKFTQLEAELEVELEAELEARRQQYEHYRDRLLSLDPSNSSWSTLEQVSLSVTSGATPKAGSEKYYKDGNIPWLRTGEVSFNEIWDTEMKITEVAVCETGVSWVDENSIIVAISGATAGRSAVNKIRLTTNQHCCNLKLDESCADYRYVFHWVGSQFQKLKSLGRGARSDLNVKIIKEFPIPLLPLEEQRRIASILDKFDALVNDLTVGLLAEIAARRKQYEYYRDRLLTFEEKR